MRGTQLVQGLTHAPSARISFAVFLWRGADFAPQHRGRDYHELHGFLAYAWRLDPRERFDSDAAQDIELAPELLTAACVEVEPYISSDVAVTTACIADDYRDQIDAHPRRELLTQLVACRDERQALWQTFSREIQRALSLDDPPAAHDARLDAPDVARYRQLWRMQLATYRELRAVEVAKIESAIDRMYALRERASRRT